MLIYTMPADLIVEADQTYVRCRRCRAMYLAAAVDAEWHCDAESCTWTRYQVTQTRCHGALVVDSRRPLVEA